MKEPKILKEWADVNNIDIVFGSIPLEKCDWIKNKNFVQFLSNYTEQIVNNCIENEKISDYFYYTMIKLRWKLQFFKFPNAEMKFAKYIGYKLKNLN